MRITLNMLIYKLKERYPEITVSAYEQMASLSIQGIRIFPETKETLANHLYLSRDRSSLSFVSRDLQTPLIYVGQAPVAVETDASVIIIRSRASMAEIFNALLEIYHSFQDWDRHMHEALIQNEPFSTFLNLSLDMIQNPLLIYDLGLKLLAYNEYTITSNDPVATMTASRGYLPPEIVQFLSRRQIFDVRNTDVIFEFPSPSALPHQTIYLPFVSDGVVTGYCVMLLVSCEDELYEKTMFRNFYEYANIAMKQIASGPKPNEFVYEYFLLDLINSPDTDRNIIREHCSYANLPYDSNFYILEFKSPNYSQTLFSFVMHQMRALYPSACVFEFQETIVFFIYKDKRIQSMSYKRQLEKYYKDLFDLTYLYDLVGAVSSSFEEIPDIKKAHQQTLDVLNMQLAKKVSSGVYYFEDEYLNIMISAHGISRYGASMLPPALKEMMREDEERGTQNMELLKIYFAENCNITQTAARMSMHRNNVVYHLRRLESHYGLDFEDANTRLLWQIYLISQSE